MLSNLLAERDRLDHQRSRIAEILENRMVSHEMEDHLRLRLAHINRRLVELGSAAQLPPPEFQTAAHHMTA